MVLTNAAEYGPVNADEQEQMIDGFSATGGANIMCVLLSIPPTLHNQFHSFSTSGCP